MDQNVRESLEILGKLASLTLYNYGIEEPVSAIREIKAALHRMEKEIQEMKSELEHRT